MNILKRNIITFAALLFVAVLVTSCNSSANKDGQAQTEDTSRSEQETPVSQEQTVESQSEPGQTIDFDLNSIPVSDIEIGDFPFFTAPEGAEYINRAKPIDFDFIVFVTPNNIYEVEGKTFRAHVHPDRKSDQEISGRYIIKSYEDAIMNAGGVKVFEGKLKDERLEQYETLCTYAGGNGSIDVWNNPIATYVIRRNGGNVYIALDKGKTNTTSIQIVQEKAFVQTIKKISADDIVKDLNNKGKSILYINFDVDKSTLKPDGHEAVDEIFKALDQDKSLQISIEGHTDDTGTKEHNKKLSLDRATTVLNELVSKGIAKERLNAAGFGSEKSLVANDSEENKAKNRRVELIRR